MASRPSIITVLKQGMAVAAAPFFRETWNWLTASWSNLKLGAGLRWTGHDSDHPTIDLALVAGDGVTIKRDGGVLRISATKEGEGQGEQGEETGTGANTSAGGGGSATSPNGADTVGGSGTAGGSGTGGAGGASVSGASSQAVDGATSCNNWSGFGVENGGAGGLSNRGDNCATINGW